MTEAEFSRQLSKLSSVAADLNRESDSINELLSQYEVKIRAMNVGLEVSVPLYDGARRDRLEWTKLTVYEKNSDGSSKFPGRKEWGLAINGSAVLDGSREDRIAALESIPHLVDGLIEGAQDRVNVIRKAKELLK